MISTPPAPNALPAPRLLPVWAAYSHMLSSITHNWRVALRHGLPWMALLTLFKVWGLWTPQSPDPQDAFSLSWPDILALAVGVVATSSIAVSWHRYILQDESPASVPAFRMDKIVWQYVGRSLFIYVVCLLPILAIAVLSDLTPLALIPIWLALGFAAIVLLIRLSLSLVATAVDARNFGLKSALMATRGNMWRFLLLILLTALSEFLLLVAWALPLAAAQPAPPPWVIGVSLVLSIPIQLLAVMLNVTMLTTLYGYFVEHRKF